MRNRFQPIDDAHVTVFHPGGRPLPTVAPRTLQQRLADAEASLLNAAVEKHVHGSGKMRDLAVSVVALRAEMGIQ